MIDEARFAEALRFLAARFNAPEPDAAIVRVMHGEAFGLATVATDEPAALFFVLARRPKVLRACWPIACTLFARNAALGVGSRLTASERELAALRLDVAMRRADFETVRAWFASRLETP